MIPSKLIAGALACTVGVCGTAAVAQSQPSSEEITEIAKEASAYALPMLMNYAVMYEYAVAVGGPQYKAPFNTLFSEANVFTYKDTEGLV